MKYICPVHGEVEAVPAFIEMGRSGISTIEREAGLCPTCGRECEVEE